MRQCFDPDFAHYKQSLRVVEKLERGGKGLNLTWEVRDGILNHTGECVAGTLEGVLVKFADRIAYINHDIDDACRAGILQPDDVPAHLREVLGHSHGDRINTMVKSIIRASRDRAEITMEEPVAQATGELRAFLFERVYTNSVAKGEEAKSKELLIRLFEYYVKNCDALPTLYRNNIEEEGVERCVCDFLSGMTDRYAIETYRSLFVPNVWRGRG